MGWFASLFLGASLAACTGLRAFLPLLTVALVSRYRVLGHFTVPEPLLWLESDPALVAVLVLAILESLGDKVPLVAALTDPFMVILRPGAGVLACLAVLSLPSLGESLVAALVVGLTLSVPIMGLKSGGRGHDARELAAFRDLRLSLAEDVVAVVGPLAAFFFPVLAFLAILSGVFLLLTRVRVEVMRQRARAAAEREKKAPEESATAAGYGPPQPGLRRQD